jgi:hypothetical protein
MPIPPLSHDFANNGAISRGFVNKIPPNNTCMVGTLGPSVRRLCGGNSLIVK